MRSFLIRRPRSFTAESDALTGELLAALAAYRRLRPYISPEIVLDVIVYPKNREKLEVAVANTQSAWQLPKSESGGFYQMKAHYLGHKAGRILAALFFVISIGFVSSSAVQAQWWPNSTGQRDRDYRREQERQIRRERERQRNDEWRRRNRNRNDDDWRYRGNRGYGNISQVAVNEGFQDGIYTGSRDAQRGQSYNPQRSHFYRNGHGDNGGYGRYGNSYQYQQAYRQGFLRGYDQGFRQYGGYNRNRNNNGRFPFPW